MIENVPYMCGLMAVILQIMDDYIVWKFIVIY